MKWYEKKRQFKKCSATVAATTACIMIKFHGTTKIGAVEAVTVAEHFLNCRFFSYHFIKKRAKI